MKARSFAQRWKQGVRNPHISRLLDHVSISSTMTDPLLVEEDVLMSVARKYPP